jgi:hypothetical protein
VRARQADADADDLSRKMAAGDAAIAAEEAERRAANAVDDDVLSVLRAVGVADRPLPWSLVVIKAKGALDALARQVTGSRPGLADLGPALRRQASQVAAELDVRCDIDDGLDLPRSAVEALGAATGEGAAQRRRSRRGRPRRAHRPTRPVRPGCGDPIR